MKSIQDPEKIKQVGEYYKTIEEANHEYQHYWMQHTFLHWDFWTSVCFSLIPWLIWFRLRKKESTARYLFVGFFVIIVSCWFDFIGVCLGRWFYTGKVMPTIPSYIPWDMSLMPVTVMLMIQFKPQMSLWLKAALFACLASFVGEPLFSWLGLYVPVKWNYFFSLPIYGLIYLVSHWLSKRKSFQ
ncbi:hypothetical protein JJB07_05420 [Tumebacillus sp. ITR2]|uniref:DUF2878 domain-containing protein n=1 Tax=Tumebacillus amylolyticus TaxID=2801339 RepID=A0ABS1J747_9BACL|nr:CBO0543 family protein [Tumebacillus amylolyticus]MBL0386088.1 hypothetical protein [Tumebacillus amylolyticus]